MAHRPNLNSLTAAGRQTLVDLMLQYLTDAVVANHTSIVHGGEEIFTGHRAYIAGMEAFLAANGGGQSVPLPKWDPATPIPAEFNVVRDQDNGTPRPPLQNPNPNRPLPAQYQPPALCNFASGAQLGNSINGWHGGVHVAIGGSMGNGSIASAAPIFWCWHAFLDDVYYDWQSCMRTPQPQPPETPPSETPPPEAPPSETPPSEIPPSEIPPPETPPSETEPPFCTRDIPEKGSYR